LILKLLDLDPDSRLDGDGIREHPWMNGVNWHNIENKIATAPFLPHQDRVNFHVTAELDDAFEMDTVYDILSESAILMCTADLKFVYYDALQSWTRQDASQAHRTGRIPRLGVDESSIVQENTNGPSLQDAIEPGSFDKRYHRCAMLNDAPAPRKQSLMRSFHTKLGLFLWEKGHVGTTGRVVFFADDIPEHTMFVTETEVEVHRIGKTVYVGPQYVINL
jgi:hypothetical protein